MSKLMTYEADLNEAPVKPQEFKSPLYLGEKNAHTIRAKLKSTDAVPADATCEGYFIYLDTQQTVKIPEAKCSYSNGVAEVTLTPDCYQIVSRVSFIMALGNLTDKIVILNLAGRVISSWTDIVVESGDLENIPDLQTLVDMINAVNHLDISSSKSGRIITITTTDRHGATQSSTITEPTATVTKEENGPYHLTVTDVNGTTVTDIPDPAAEVKKKANRSSVTADRTISGTGKVEFPDALDEPMSLNLKLEPKQDLHGYDKPWVGGSGKNLAPINLNNGNPYILNNLTFVNAKVDDNIIGISGNGTANASNNFFVGKTPVTSGVAYKMCNYTETGTTATYWVRFVFRDSSSTAIDVGGSPFIDVNALSDRTITAPSNAVELHYYINFANGVTLNNVVFKIVIYEATSAPNGFEPYSNISPITGYDSIRVTSVGKNLFPSNWETGTIDTSGNPVDSDPSYYRVQKIKVEPNCDYFLSFNGTASGSAFRYFLYKADGSFTGTFAAIVGPLSISTGTDTGYISFRWLKNLALTNIQLEQGSVATSYAPYSQILTLNLTSAAGGTVYGGTVTVNEDGSGELVVDRACVTLSGLSAESGSYSTTAKTHYITTIVAPGMKNANYTAAFTGICDRFESYPGTPAWPNVTKQYIGFGPNQSFRFSIPGVTEYSEALQIINGSQVAYYLDTPQSYPLTASQINSLLGYTQVITDTDGALTVGYKTDKYAKLEKFLAALPSDMATGDPAVFTDGADGLPMKKLTVDIQPKQDLHGYDKPWVGGAGKNRTPDIENVNTWADNVTGTSHTISDGIMTIVMNDGISSGVYTKASSDIRAAIAQLTGDYTWSIYLKADKNISLGVGVQGVDLSSYSIGTGWTRISHSAMYAAASNPFCIYNNGGSGTGTTVYAKNLMFESGSTATDYEPYSNICPIEAWDEVNVTRTGKNLLSLGTRLDGFATTNDGKFKTWSSSAAGYWFETATLPSVITFNAVNGNRAYLSYYNQIPANNIPWAEIDQLSQTLPRTISVNKKYPYIHIQFSYDREVENVQVEAGAVSTDYEAPKDVAGITFPVKTITGSTVYGGTLTVNADGTGEVVVDRGLRKVSDSTWTIETDSNSGLHYFSTTNIENIPKAAPIISDRYLNVTSSLVGRTPGTIGRNSGSNLYINDQNYSDIASFLAGAGDSEYSYPLSTPTSYPLTATQLETLLGTNTVWCDAGEVTVEYCADVGKYIEKKIQALG